MKLKNKIAGGGDKTFTVSPVYVTPENGNGQATTIEAKLVKRQLGSITIKVPFGGFTATSNSTSIATVSANNSTGVITVTGVNPGQATITVANTQDKNKSRTYTVNVAIGGAYTVQDSEKIVANGLYWTIGYLVANGTNGCKIGLETDYGLRFSWGSLYGERDGNIVKPDKYVSQGANRNPNNAMDLRNGIGDPCKVYLTGNWRMPTADEIRAIGGNVSKNKNSFGKEYYYFSDSYWSKRGGRYGLVLNSRVFFSSNFSNKISTGFIQEDNEVVQSWTSTPDGYGNGYYLQGGSAMRESNLMPGYGSYPVRCVQAPS